VVFSLPGLGEAGAFGVDAFFVFLGFSYSTVGGARTTGVTGVIFSLTGVVSGAEAGPGV